MNLLSVFWYFLIIIMIQLVGWCSNIICDIIVTCYEYKNAKYYVVSVNQRKWKLNKLYLLFHTVWHWYTVWPNKNTTVDNIKQKNEKHFFSVILYYNWPLPLTNPEFYIIDYFLCFTFFCENENYNYTNLLFFLYHIVHLLE